MKRFRAVTTFACTGRGNRQNAPSHAEGAEERIKKVPGGAPGALFTRGSTQSATSKTGGGPGLREERSAIKKLPKYLEAENRRHQKGTKLSMGY